MTEKVVIIGAGIAGLTAAHELVERGFEVHVYERRSYCGGKAASARMGGAGGVPIEHGFRFFPGWYRHLPDTLKRIPYRGQREFYEGASVFDNLITVDAGLLAWYDRDQVRAPMHVPRSADQASTFLSFADRLRSLGLEPGEIAFFGRKLADFMLMSEADRLKLLEPISWWAYLDADQKSQAFRDLIAATTRGMVAAKAEEASAYTISRLAVRTMFDALSTVDRVLNGPTNEVWIEPWVSYLESRGVVFHRGYELASLNFRPGEKALHSVQFERQAGLDLQRARRALARLRQLKIFETPPVLGDEILARQERDVASQASLDVEALGRLQVEYPWLREHARTVVEECSDVLRVVCTTSSPKSGKGSARATGVRPNRSAVKTAKLVAALELASQNVEAALPARSKGAVEPIVADYFVFALPVEQMAYYVNRSMMLKHHDPSLEHIVELARHVDWMAGIQFYLKEPLELARGHIVFMDSEWGLTAIEHKQFWRETKLPSDIQSVLSVDIASWDRKGRYLQKEAFDCSHAEIASEVWQQLKGSLNRDRRSQQLRDDMLRGTPKLASLSANGTGNYHLDESVADLFDRKKQAAYEKARGVRPGQPQGVAPWSTAGDTPYVWGGRAQYNLEPLLVNRAGARALRPEAKTEVRNMFLAADYVLTETDLACMEGANEAARRAVNALLDAAASREERCATWRLTTADQLAGWLTSFDWLPAGVDTAMGAARSLGKFAGGLLGVAGRMAGVTMGSMNRR